jgi:hypothetical protein
MKYYELVKENHIVGVTNSYHDIPLLKNAIKSGYKITKVTITTDKQDIYGRIVANNIILK